MCRPTSAGGNKSKILVKKAFATLVPRAPKRSGERVRGVKTTHWFYRKKARFASLFFVPYTFAAPKGGNRDAAI